MTPRDACRRDYEQAAALWAVAVRNLDLDAMWVAWQRAEAAVTRAKTLEQQQTPRPSHL